MVEKIIYPRMQRFIYGAGNPYITENERKLNELDIQEISKPLEPLKLNKFFNFLTTRIVSDRYRTLSKIDRILLIMLRPLGHLLAGRILFSGHISK